MKFGTRNKSIKNEWNSSQLYHPNSEQNLPTLPTKEMIHTSQSYRLTRPACGSLHIFFHPSTWILQKLYGSITNKGCKETKEIKPIMMGKLLLWIISQDYLEYILTMSTLTGFPSSARISTIVPDWSACMATKGKYTNL